MEGGGGGNGTTTTTTTPKKLLKNFILVRLGMILESAPAVIFCLVAEAKGQIYAPSSCCFTSTEARLLIRDGDGGGGGGEREDERVKGSAADTPEKDRGPPPERWKC